MHPSEWNTILQNLYSNAKKAIIRSNVLRGKIFVESNKKFESKYTHIRIPRTMDLVFPLKYKDRVFDAFFLLPRENRDEDLGTNTGLGLYILYQMIKKQRRQKYPWKIQTQDIKTNIRIILPLATK